MDFKITKLILKNKLLVIGVHMTRKRVRNWSLARPKK